ncbi:hypothetical protein GCM10023075_51670 [Streptosporangium album]
MDYWGNASMDRNALLPGPGRPRGVAGRRPVPGAGDGVFENAKIFSADFSRRYRACRRYLETR